MLCIYHGLMCSRTYRGMQTFGDVTTWKDLKKKNLNMKHPWWRNSTQSHMSKHITAIYLFINC